MTSYIQKIGPGWSGPLTNENCTAVAEAMVELLLNSTFREVYRKGDSQHNFPDLFLPPWKLPNESIIHKVCGDTHTLEIVNAHNVLYAFDTSKDISVVFTDHSIELCCIEETVVETLEFILQAMPAIASLDQPPSEELAAEAQEAKREMGLIVHVEGADLEGLVAWLRHAADLVEEGYKEMNTEVESAAGSFFVEVLEPEEDSEEKINDETSQE